MTEQLNSDEEAARERHRKRIEEMRRSKRRQMLFRKFGPPVAGIILVLFLAFLGMRFFGLLPAADHGKSVKQEEDKTGERPENGEGADSLKEKDAPKANEEADNSKEEDTPEENQGTDNLKEEDTPEARADNSKEIDTPEENGEVDSSKRNDDAAKTDEAEQPLKAGLLRTKSMASAFIRGKAMPEVKIALEALQEAGQSRSYAAETTENTLKLEDKLASGEEFFSQYAVLIDLESQSILAQKDDKTRINPASMTKILTVLVAAEHVEDLDDTITITLDITDYGFRHKCSSAGFERDETVTVRDLFYGTVLPSGADAAVGLAIYVAGSQEAFVELMNEKLKELGLAETTHFTNCVGVYDENHYSTVYDMAMILEAAVDNEMCREFLSAHRYTTSATQQHPEGIDLSNLFLRRIEDKDSGGEVVYAKTGFVEQSGNCAASYAQGKDGKRYICVTANANSPWRCIYDHFRLYKQFLG